MEMGNHTIHMFGAMKDPQYWEDAWSDLIFGQGNVVSKLRSQSLTLGR